MRISPAQRRALEAMLGGDLLHEVQHVRLQDGTSYFIGNMIRVHGATAYALIRLKLVDLVKRSVGGGTYRINDAGRAAAVSEPKAR